MPRLSGRRPWQIFLAFTGLYVIAYFYRVSAAVIADDLVAELRLTPGQLGAMSAALFYAFALAQLPLGPLLDRFGSRWIVGLCGLLSAAGALLFAAADDFAGLFWGRFLIGAGTASVLMGSLKAYTRWFAPQQFATLAGLQVALGNCGNLLATAPLAAMAATVGWRGTFAGVALLTAGWALLLMLWVRDLPDGAEPSAQVRPAGSWRQLLRSGDFWRLSLLAFFWYGSYMAVQGLWGVPYLTQVLGLPAADAAWLLMLTASGFILGCPLAGRLSDRWLASRKRLLLPAQVGQLLLLLLFLGGLERLPSLLLPAVFLLLGLCISAGPLLYAQIKELFPMQMAATAMTMVNFFVVLGAALLQQLMGQLVGEELTASGLHRAFLLPTGGLLLGLLVYLGSSDSSPQSRQ